MGFLDGDFRGTVYIQMHEGLSILGKNSGLLARDTGLDFERYAWEMFPSPRGGYHIRASTGFYTRDLWSVDPQAERQLVFTNATSEPGVRETFLLERHGDAYAFRSVATNRYLAALPRNLGAYVEANRPEKKAWEKFWVQVAPDVPPDDPAPPVRSGPKPFICTRCGGVMASCDGNVVGAECLLVHHPTGGYKCRHCPQLYYLVKHTHWA
jgi:hypothetical protein